MVTVFVTMTTISLANLSSVCHDCKAVLCAKICSNQFKRIYSNNQNIHQIRGKWNGPNHCPWVIIMIIKSFWQLSKITIYAVNDINDNTNCQMLFKISEIMIIMIVMMMMTMMMIIITHHHHRIEKYHHHHHHHDIDGLKETWLQCVSDGVASLFHDKAIDRYYHCHYHHELTCYSC